MILMTSNQWKCDTNRPAWEARGEDCSAPARVPGLVRAYSTLCPDVIAMQESSPLMGEMLLPAMRAFAPYAYLSGGDTPLLYRTDTLRLFASGFLRFPEEIEGLPKTYNDLGTKSYAFGVFTEKASGKRFAAVSLHLWWMIEDVNSPYYRPEYYCEGSDAARARQMELVCREADRLATAYACPVFLMGDYNSCIGSPATETAVRMGYTEAHDLATGERDETRGHHPCGPAGYERGVPGVYADAIDHIYVKGTAHVASYLRITDPYFDSVSDHYPLYIEVTLG